jgi:probable phosphoglycerate mutase
MKPHQPATTIFGLIRHAETLWNREKRIQGHLDSPLTAAGEENALGWGARLASGGWDRVVASDLGRAAATAECVNRSLALPLALEPLLREQDWGMWSGRTVDDLLREIPDLTARYADAGWDFCPPGGESRDAVRRRGVGALRRAAARWPGERILVVTHAGTIRCLVNGLTGRRFLPSEPPILRAGHLHRLVHGADGLRVERLNAVDLEGRRRSGPLGDEADFITDDAKS